jgi:carbon monoxide dehydrogenase subunit G
MELTNEFRVSVPVDQAWAVLTDVERIAPCLPGAELQEVEGDEYRGVVKVKVGPITAQYKGKATFQSRDDTAHVAVLKAEGRDTRGAGNASATITATLTPDGDGTRVSVATDLTITGKVAQFGRGMLAEVSSKLLGQFVEQLESTVLAESPAASAPADADATFAPPPDTPFAPPPSAARKIESAPAQPVDLLDAAGGSVAKRVAPLVGALAVLWLLLRRRRRRG